MLRKLVSVPGQGMGFFLPKILLHLPEHGFCIEIANDNGNHVIGNVVGMVVIHYLLAFHVAYRLFCPNNWHGIRGMLVECLAQCLFFFEIGIFAILANLLRNNPFLLFEFLGWEGRMEKHVGHNIQRAVNLNFMVKRHVGGVIFRSLGIQIDAVKIQFVVKLLLRAFLGTVEGHVFQHVAQTVGFGCFVSQTGSHHHHRGN